MIELFNGIYDGCNSFKYRVTLQGEDGYYTLADGYKTEDQAYKKLKGLEPAYGEGQELFVEQYLDA